MDEKWDETYITAGIVIEVAETGHVEIEGTWHFLGVC